MKQLLSFLTFALVASSSLASLKVNPNELPQNAFPDIPRDTARAIEKSLALCSNIPKDGVVHLTGLRQTGSLQASDGSRDLPSGYGLSGYVGGCIDHCEGEGGIAAFPQFIVTVEITSKKLQISLPASVDWSSASGVFGPQATLSCH